MTTEAASGEPRTAVTASRENVVERLAEHLGGADARAIYGSPIERHGTTVIPVAKVRYGFGGGSGHKPSNGAEGTGGGGGVNISPVGFIEMRDGVAKFRRIRTSSPALTALGFGVAAWLVSRAVKRLIASW